MESLQGMQRTHYCGELRKNHIGDNVTLMGWVQRARDLGSLIFVDLRDREGICQIVFNEDQKDLYEKAKMLHGEYVIAISGKVVERSSKNPDLKTGDIEILADELRILEEAKTPPIYILDDDTVNEEMRLRYRYLDLRKGRMQRMLKNRAKISRLFREYLYNNGFIEVETPYLGKPTPEGARDYLVPSRVNPGKFYALPQSPQLMKQLLMVGGTDRYYQIVRCFRDEDLRANRQPEFTQVDIEMSFVDMEDVLAINEGLVCHIFKEFKGIDLPRPFARMTYAEAMNRFGVDKPDLRYGFEITDISAIREYMDFDLFEKEAVLAINFTGLSEKYSRKKLKKLEEYAKGIGAYPLLWVKKEGEITSSFNKFLTDSAKTYLEETMRMQEGDLLVILSGDRMATLENLGALRIAVAKEHVVFDEDTYAITWIVDFPLFEYSEEENRLVSKHHPFTAVLEEDLLILQSEPEKARSKAYDLVINGDECAGGSIRIHQSKVQKEIFEILKLSEEDISERFGFFTEALQYGTPPHGGIAYGLDRFVMTLTGETNIRDVLAFPKTRSATDLMTDAPTQVGTGQLKELSVEVVKELNENVEKSDGC